MIAVARMSHAVCWFIRATNVRPARTSKLDLYQFPPLALDVTFAKDDLVIDCVLFAVHNAPYCLCNLQTKALHDHAAHRASK